jgi:hypothetical protein
LIIFVVLGSYATQHNKKIKEIKMNAPDFDPEEAAAETLPEWYDPFVEPQTYPAGWDVSEMLHAEDAV